MSEKAASRPQRWHCASDKPRNKSKREKRSEELNLVLQKMNEEKNTLVQKTEAEENNIIQAYEAVQTVYHWCAKRNAH